MRTARVKSATHMPAKISPQLCTLVVRPPVGDEWAHEIKWDGYRLLVRVEDGRTKVQTRNGHDWTERFPTLVADIRKLPVKSAYFDGELCALDKRGASHFSDLQAAIGKRKDEKLVYFVFDLIFLDGDDLRPHRLEDRREKLKKLLVKVPQSRRHSVRLSETIEADGAEFFKHACAHKLEGIISKRRDAVYRSGRTKTWLKIKCSPRGEFVIGGYTLDTKGRTLGSVLVGHFERRQFVYDGRVGTGFSHALARSLLASLRKIETDKTPFKRLKPSHEKRAHWVRPKIVCEVKFTARTADGYLRQASFQGFCEDKKASQVTGVT